MATWDELRSKHGTPEEFECAVWKAYNQFFITMEEATAAIGKYREEYAATPDRPMELPQDDQIVKEVL
jgi:uncharacterized protein